MSFLGEIKRRKVFQVAAVYLVVAWLIMQVVDVVSGPLLLPDWFARVVILLLAIGLPIALILSWAFDLTPDGVVRDEGGVSTQSGGRRIEYVLFGLLLLAVGFMFIDNYVLEDDSDSEAVVDEQPETVPPAVAEERPEVLPNSVAVLPFGSLSPNPNDAFYADGIHIELLSLLHKIQDLTAISRDSVVQFRDSNLSNEEIANLLGVGAILRGNVRYDGNSVRVSVDLIEPITNVPMWSEVYDGDLADVFGFQTAIATAIARALEAELLPAERALIAAVPSEIPQAIEAFYAGKQLVAQRNPESLLGAILNFQSAVSSDPKFVLAWSGLAEAWIELPNYSSVLNLRRVRSESELAATMALEVDPESPDALAILGWHLLRHSYDWAQADEFFQRALRIEATNVNALHWYSHLLSWQGRHSEAIERANEAVAAVPLSTLMLTNLSYILADAKQWRQSFELGAEILSRDSYSSLMANLWIANLRAGHPEEAGVHLENWVRAEGRDIDAARELNAEITRLHNSGESSERIGDLILGLRLPTSIPEVYAVLGDTEGTITALYEAHSGRTGDRSLLSMGINPSYDFIRDDSRFIKLLGDIGLAN